MSIRFVCPSCSNPIEVDNEWADRSVACPYCRNVVTAPGVSTYAASETIPAARAVREDAPSAAGNPAAVWAFGLSCLWLLAFLVGSTVLASYMVDRVGREPTQDEMIEILQEELRPGSPPPRELVIVAGTVFASLGFWVGGLVCAILALRRPPRRRLAYTAFAVLAVGPALLCLGPGC